MSINYNNIVPDLWITIQSTGRCLAKSSLAYTSGAPCLHYLGLAGTGAFCTISCILSPSNWFKQYNKFFISSQLTAEGTLDILEGYQPHSLRKGRRY